MNYPQYVCKSSPLPHFNQRRFPIAMIVIHSMAHRAEDGIARLNELQLSSHYVIDLDGTVFNCVDEQYRSWHAGVSSWSGLNDINSRSIGIELCHQSLGQSRFHRRQIKSLINLCHYLIKRYDIAPTMIVGHSDIAPERKPDPGKAFPWQELAEQQIGIWYGNEHSELSDIATMLTEIGYNCTNLPAAAYAFCRHFLPAKVQTMATRRLLNHPFPPENYRLLADQEFIAAVQNIHFQYQKSRITL